MEEETRLVTVIILNKVVYQTRVNHLPSGNAWISEPEVLGSINHNETLTITLLSVLNPYHMSAIYFSHHISVKGRNKTMKTFHIKWSATALKPRRHRASSWKLALLDLMFFAARPHPIDFFFKIIATYKTHISSAHFKESVVFLIIYVPAVGAYHTCIFVNALEWVECFQAKYLCSVWMLNGFTQYLSSPLSRRRPLALMWLFFFEGRTVMCFSQSSLYCCQRRWSGCKDRAMVRSFRMFYRLLLNHRKFVPSLSEKVCRELEVYFIYADVILG